MELNKRKIRRNLSLPNYEIKKRSPKVEITEEMLNTLKENIAQMEKLEKAKKPVRPSSSFLSTSRADGNQAPSLQYISKGLKESPSVGRYTPRYSNMFSLPNYSFSK